MPTIDTGMIKVTRRPRGWRRAVRITGKIAGGLFALVALLVIFLHTPWGKSVVKGRIEAKLGALSNGKVTLGELDYGFLFGSIELGKLEIRDTQDRKAISIDSIALDLDRGALLGGEVAMGELKIDGVDVNVIKNADGTSNLTGLFKPSDRKPLKGLRIGKLSVSGAALITKSDGSTIAVRDLGIAGSVDARPASKELDLAIDTIATKLEITKPDSTREPGTAEKARQIDIALGGIVVKRRIDAVDLDIAKLTAGALGIEKLGAHVKLADGKLRGEQAITLGKARIDSKQLAELVGREVILDDIGLDLSVTGPESKLAIRGAIKTGETGLTITGSADLTATPKYKLTIAGKGRSADITAKAKHAVETDLSIEIDGSGASALDLDTKIAITVGPTKIGKLVLDGLTAKAHAKRGAYKLEQLIARAVDFEIVAAADLAADKSLSGKVSITGSPAKATKALAAAGIAIPKQLPGIGQVAFDLSADGKLDGELAIALAPTKIAIAGGHVALAGSASLANRKLAIAKSTIELSKLDLASLAALAGRPAKAKGLINGKIEITKTPTDRDIDLALAVALRDKPVTITVKGDVSNTSALAHAEVRRRGDRSLLASLDASLPLDAQGFQPRGAWRVKADVANRQLSELASLLGRTLPAGDVAIHADLAGSPAQPTGSIAITATAAAIKNVPGKQKIDLRATLSPSVGRLAVNTKGSIALANQSSLATLAGTISMPLVWNGKSLDKAGLRAGLAIDTVIEIPERPLASLASIRSKLGELGGTLGGRIAAKGPAKSATIDARLAWRGYKNAAGSYGETTIAATGTAAQPSLTINHGNALLVYADIDRSNQDRIAIKARTRSAKTPLAPLLPAFLAAKLGGNEPGTLHWNMDGNIVLAKTAQGMQVDLAAITGGLDVTGGSVKIPATKRTYRDIALSVAAEPAGLRIKKLSLRESDLEKSNRTLAVNGLVSLDKLKAKKVELSLAARDWLVFGGEKFGMPDAPRATATFDIGVAVDLSQPVLGIDATVHSLALRSPDRLERGHYVEKASVSGDIVVIDGNTKVGKLATAVVAPTAAKKRRAMDIRVHIPKSIRLEQTPMDVWAKGELTIAVRDDGAKTRGKLVMERGNLNLFGRDHALVEGSVEFSDKHPQGFMALTFERELPAVAMRDLARSSGPGFPGPHLGSGPGFPGPHLGSGPGFPGPHRARVTFNGSPTKPKTSLSGAANAAMFEVMAMYNAGRPTSVARPGLPSSSLVQAPRGDQLFMLTFMASNLPHLLFLDRINAWSDPYAASYGRIANMEAEKYSRDQKARVRAIVRPNTPGRSSAELQYDRVLINTDRAAVGVGVRAGDRLGGGVGAFVEWSSKD